MNASSRGQERQRKVLLRWFDSYGVNWFERYYDSNGIPKLDLLELSKGAGPLAECLKWVPSAILASLNRSPWPFVALLRELDAEAWAGEVRREGGAELVRFWHAAASQLRGEIRLLDWRSGRGRPGASRSERLIEAVRKSTVGNETVSAALDVLADRMARCTPRERSAMLDQPPVKAFLEEAKANGDERVRKRVERMKNVVHRAEEQRVPLWAKLLVAWWVTGPLPVGLCFFSDKALLAFFDLLGAFGGSSKAERSDAAMNRKRVLRLTKLRGSLGLVQAGQKSHWIKGVRAAPSGPPQLWFNEKDSERRFTWNERILWRGKERWPTLDKSGET